MKYSYTFLKNFYLKLKIFESYILYFNSILYWLIHIFWYIYYNIIVAME